MNLKPCPFITDSYTGFMVWCSNCEAEGPVEPTMPAAEMSWNNREDL